MPETGAAGACARVCGNTDRHRKTARQTASKTLNVAAIVASKPTRWLNTDPKLSAAPKTPGLPAAD